MKAAPVHWWPAADNLLDLITFYTLNRNEARAWSLNRDKKVTEAAARVHSDMEKGFIKAEVIGAESAVRGGFFFRSPGNRQAAHRGQRLYS
ncbi:MAG: DUF933 domain-containing protein [Actinomycetota bacterium]|nr:DUF933 domain-containing protein [Actinomycetota bacterium]